MQNLDDIHDFFVEMYMYEAEDPNPYNKELEARGDQAFERLLDREIRHPLIKEERAKWIRALATPPEGWSVFGTHASDFSVPALEFWGIDPDDGMPLWERPVQP